MTIDATTLIGACILTASSNYIASPIVESEMQVLQTLMLILMSMGAFEDWIWIVPLTIPLFLSFIGIELFNSASFVNVPEHCRRPPQKISRS